MAGIIGALNYDQSNYEIFNLGNDQTITLSELIKALELNMSREAILDKQPNQPGDVPQTWADISKAKNLLSYAPKTTFLEGIEKYIAHENK